MGEPRSSSKIRSLTKGFWKWRKVSSPFQPFKKGWPRPSAARAYLWRSSISACARSMAYRVKLTPRAQKDIEELYRWVILRAPHQGGVWYNGLIDAIGSLADHPQRCPIS